MNYNLVVSGDPQDLVDQVNKHLSEGWLPVGGIAIAINDFHSVDHEGSREENAEQIFAQAMIQPEKKERKIIQRAFTQ